MSNLIERADFAHQLQRLRDVDLPGVSVASGRAERERQTERERDRRSDLSVALLSGTSNAVLGVEGELSLFTSKKKEWKL